MTRRTYRGADLALVGAAALALLVLLPALGPVSGTSGESFTPASQGAGLIASSAPTTLTQLLSAPLDPVSDATYVSDLAGTQNLGAAQVGSIHVAVGLRLPNQARLSSLLAELSDAKSPTYRHFLSASEFNAEFSPPASAYGSLVTYLSAFPIHNLTQSRDRLTLSFDASAVTVNEIFHTQLDRLHRPGATYFAPSSPPELPASLAAEVVAVDGLSSSPVTTLHTDLARPVFLHLRATTGKPSAPEPAGSYSYLAPPNVSGVQYEFGPDFQVAYDEQSLFSEYGFARGSVVATLLWSGEYIGPNITTPYGPLHNRTFVGPFVPNDVASFFSETIPVGQPLPQAVGVPIDGAPTPGPFASWDTTGANWENTLDLEMVGSTAPGASIFNVYGASNTLADLDSAFSFVLSPNASYPALDNVSVISNSWGGSDLNDTMWYDDLEEAQLRGITVLASTGDSGDNPASPKAPASGVVEFPSTVATDTFGVVAVGGTTVALLPSLHLQSNVIWNETSGPYGSTGGISTLWPEPSWQLSSNANSEIGGLGRGVPDLAGLANRTIVTISVKGAQYRATNASLAEPFYALAGTSVASPLTAGLVAEMDHVLEAAHNAPLGFLDPAMYPLADLEYSALLNTTTTGFFVTGAYAAGLPTLPFLDVTAGSNFLYAAHSGYDLVTGWGSLDAYNYTMYFLEVPSAGILGHLTGVRDILSLTGLDVTSRFANGTVNSQYNASIQQNFFLANSLGAPVYWVQNVIYISPGGAGHWTVDYTGWVVFPFYGLYPTLTVYEYNVSLPAIVVATPTVFNVTTTLTAPTGPLSAGLTFGVNGENVTLLVPGGAWIQGNYSDRYSWQGTNYTNGPFPGTPALGGLSPQIGLVGGPSAGIGDFEALTAGTLSAQVQPWGGRFTAAGMAAFGLNASETGEVADNLSWTPGSGNSWNLTEVTGSRTQGVVTYEPLSAVQTYQVQVNETGLPGGTSWSVSIVGGSTYSSSTPGISFGLTNGTYHYTISSTNPGYSPNPSSGILIVAGTSVNLSVAFEPKRVTVSFVESSLPAGTPWSVTFNGVTNATVGTSIVFSQVTGTYAYLLGAVPGYSSTVPRGNVTVAGAPVDIVVVFSPFLFTVTFRASGLPSGAQWSVSVSGVVRTSGTSDITFQEPNGSYAYAVIAPAGYDAHASGSSVGVAGSDVLVNVTLSGTTVGSGGVLGLSGVGLALLLVGVGILAAAVGVGLARRRRKRNPPRVVPPPGAGGV